MQHLTRIVETFPSVIIPNSGGRLPVEVSLIAQLGHGAGSHLFYSIANRQKSHDRFIDALEEPSAKLGGTNFDMGDSTSLYSFVVGPGGHPFHRHAGHRIFTAVSGSGGAQLRFSTATDEDLKASPRRFLDAMHFVNIPPDCLFCVRFGGETWHQFWPLSKNSLHPVFFALSAHTDELGGNLPDDLKAKIRADEADIPTLTEVLPQDIAALVHSRRFQEEVVATTTLSLDAPAGTIHRKVCDTVRGNLGILRGIWSNWRGPSGYVSRSKRVGSAVELTDVPANSLLLSQFPDAPPHHVDTFCVSLIGSALVTLPAEVILEHLLEGFLNNAPRGVSRLMLVRNILVRPLGLRTSSLGCPVSSLLSDERGTLFANRYPVLGKEISQDNARAQVVLGATDKHLIFRSCVGVEVREGGQIDLTLGTSVRCKNSFGRFYMWAISAVHRMYISPTMLRRAAEYMVARLEA